MTDSTRHWLPEHHLGVAATLSHAGELIGQVGDLLFDYQTQVPGVVGLREVPLHTNHAKHRTPAITAVRLAAMYHDDQMPRSMRDLPLRPEEPLRVGDVIAEAPMCTRVPTTLFPTVGINRPGTDRWRC